MTESLIDAETWEMMKSMTDATFLGELLDTFHTDSLDLIEQMRSGLGERNIDTVRRAAHSLKSNSASLGANRLAEACRDLEFLAKGGTLEGAEPKLALVESEFTQLVPVLEGLKNEL
jgi:HPt (histidine-containing phosphotransfer) domain-containing protein